MVIYVFSAAYMNCLAFLSNTLSLIQNDCDVCSPGSIYRVVTITVYPLTY